MASGARKRMSHTSESKMTGPLEYRHSLDNGDRGALVLWAQSRLTEHGVYEGPLDGRFRLDTGKAVRAFQDRHGLKVTGVIDRRTWDLL